MPSNHRIIIKCQCVPCHDWMAFAVWHSFRRFVPDAKVFVDVELGRPIFRWAQILSSRVRSAEDGDLVLPPTVVAVRDFSGDLSISPAKSESQTCLVDYSEGCGNFVVDKWINTNQHPFHNATRRFGVSRMTVNEVAVLKVWEGCESVYRAVGV